MAIEHQLYCFASNDMGAAPPLARRFSWSENVLWKENVEGKRLTVVLSEKESLFTHWPWGGT